MEYLNDELHSNEEAEKEYINSLSPVVVFAYNRKDHLEKTINSLSKNLYAKDTVVYVFSDGARPNHIDGVKEVREFLHNYDSSLFKDFIVVERIENWGLGKNIIDGVTNIIRKHKKIIVLEDDIVTSPYYLQYMNDALMLYKDNENVMEVAGFIPRFVDNHATNNAFFLKWASSWGWGTWKNRWDKFERNPGKLIRSISEKDKYTVNINGVQEAQWNQVLRNYKGEIYTWAIFWSVSIIKNGGLVLYSGKNMCKNIGFDGSGDNCGSINVDDFPENDIIHAPVVGFPSLLEVDCKNEKDYIESIRERDIAIKIATYKSIPRRLIKKIYDFIFT